MHPFAGTIESKLPHAGTTIFAVMSGLAQECGAINLSQGFPDFAVSPELIALVNEKMKAGYNQYAPMPGILPLRERIAEKIQRLYGAAYDPGAEITITAGGTQALYTAITATVQPGDEVIVFEPAYDSYVPAVTLAGGLPVPLHLKPPHYGIDWDEVAQAVTLRTRMIVINTPHNPAGSVLAREDMERLQEITDDTDILVLSDEVYEHVIFDGLPHESVTRYPGLVPRSFVVFSFGKTYHATGWKTGYVLAPAHLMVEFRKVHQFNVFAANTPIQHALAGYMGEGHYDGLPSFYQAKRDAFLSYMTGSRFRPLPCRGSYFALFDYSDLSDEKDTDYAVRLTREHGVAAVPVSVFYTDPPDRRILRFCFAKEDATLRAAAERLQKVS
jgi:methionine aminotransferase